MRGRENRVELTREQRLEIVEIIKPYIEEKFEVEVGGLQVEFFVDFLAEKVGRYFYNVGVQDSYAHMEEKVEDLYLLMKDLQERS